MALMSVVAASLMKGQDILFLPVTLYCLAIATAIGLVNGLLVVKTGLPSTRDVNWISPGAARESSITRRLPGRVGCRNLADMIRNGARLAPRRASIARSVSLNSTAPGMMGSPGKCPCDAG